MLEPQDTMHRPFGQGHEEIVHDPEDRLALVVDMVRRLSGQDDPQELVSIFRRRSFRLYGGDSSLSLSRRDLDSPHYRITRSTHWKKKIDPWKQRELLPLLRGGLLAELIYGDEPRILKNIRAAREDPAHEYLKSARSLVALPLYDKGVALNMVVHMSKDPGAFDSIRIADAVLESNLFGRATNSLVLAGQVRAAYAELDREMKKVGEIQRALLPKRLPTMEALDIAVSYATAARAGGDYYDFFDMGDGRLGVVIADVSGHGTPAAVVMAMLRTMLRTHCYQCSTPGELLDFANGRLCEHLDGLDGTFVTAFYGIFDPGDRTFLHACAGHNPPLLVDRETNVRELDRVQSLPLGVEAGTDYPQSSVTLRPGDTLLLYTDGITEAADRNGEMYGRRRLLSCVREDVPSAQHIIDCVVHKLMAFEGSQAPQDDQTLLAIRIK